MIIIKNWDIKSNFMVILFIWCNKMVKKLRRVVIKSDLYFISNCYIKICLVQTSIKRYSKL